MTDALYRAGEKTDGTSSYSALALSYLNRAYRTLYMGGGEFSPQPHENWYWMDETDDGAAAIDAVIRSGTVALTRGSEEINLSQPPAQSVVDYRLRIEGDEDIYTVASHDMGGAVARLKIPYNGASAPARDYRLMRFNYPMPLDAIRISSPVYFYRDGGRECLLTDLRNIRRHRISGAALAGVPEFFALDETDLVFSHYGSDSEGERMVYDFKYMKRPPDLTNSSLEEAVVPKQWRHVLADMALYQLYVDKDDTRAPLIGQQVTGAIQAMKRENRAFLSQSGEPGHIYPRRNPRRRMMKTASGRLI